jgi:RNA polymerase sigma factor (sigma-70 family)
MTRTRMQTKTTDKQTDNEVWERASAGDPGAFAQLYERHARAIYNYLFRGCADWALAEDLTSVVFLEAFRSRARVQMEPGKVLPWLYGVATNVLRNQRRSLRRHTQALRRLPPPEPVRGLVADVIDRLDAEREMRTLLGALDKLPYSDREVLALCVWSELSYEDAAVALGVPVGTVRSRLSRARARLRKLAAARGPHIDPPREHNVDAPPNEGVCES